MGLATKEVSSGLVGATRSDRVPTVELTNCSMVLLLFLCLLTQMLIPGNNRSALVCFVRCGFFSCLHRLSPR